MCVSHNCDWRKVRHADDLPACAMARILLPTATATRPLMPVSISSKIIVPILVFLGRDALKSKHDS
jgi:hypothetical protein